MSKRMVYAAVLADQARNLPSNSLNADTLLTSPGRIYTNGVGSQSGGGLFDAISEISPTDIKTTTIVWEMQYGVPTEHRDNFTQYGSAFFAITVTVDWVNLEVTWVGQQTGSSGYGVWNGRSNIELVGSSISLNSVSGTGAAGVLVTGPNRKILAFPFSPNGVGNEWNDNFARNTYAITTDTGVIVTATPTPPAETSTEEVSGIKISELDAADSLIDTDLFVLSRDDPAGNAYDASYNVTLSKMRGRAVLFDGTNGLNVVNIMNLDSNETLTSNQLDFNLTMGTTNTVPDGFGGTKTVDLSSVPATARNILVFASIDSSQNEYCSWKYKHPSGSSWIYYIRSQDNGGYPNSNNSAVPLESGGKVDFQFNSSSAFGPLHSLDLHIVGYEL